MAIKKSLKKKKAPITRSMRAPATVVDVTDEMVEEAVSMSDDPMDTYVEGDLTPEQQSEKDALEGKNAAAMANNYSIKEQRGLESTFNAWKATEANRAAYEAFKALPEEERLKIARKDPSAIADKKSYKGVKK